MNFRKDVIGVVKATDFMRDVFDHMKIYSNIFKHLVTLIGIS